MATTTIKKVANYFSSRRRKQLTTGIMCWLKSNPVSMKEKKQQLFSFFIQSLGVYPPLKVCWPWPDHSCCSLTIELKYDLLSSSITTGVTAAWEDCLMKEVVFHVISWRIYCFCWHPKSSYGSPSYTNFQATIFFLILFTLLSRFKSLIFPQLK